MTATTNAETLQQYKSRFFVDCRASTAFPFKH